jgi:hypothetical protein
VTRSSTEKVMNATVISAILCVLLAGAVRPVAGSPVYKWVDEAGVVNYSADPPPGRGKKTSIIDSANVKVSSYDPVSAGLDANSQMRWNSEYLRNRADQLQRQLDGLNYARQSAAEAAEQAQRRKFEQCQQQRRVDCDDDYEDIGYPRVALLSRQALFPARFVVPAAAAKGMPPSHHRVRHPAGTRRNP